MKKKYGFTLAEMMVVMLIITIILAAFAPLATKRIVSQSRNKNNVWNWVLTNQNYDAYYIPDVSSNTGMSFFMSSGVRESLLAMRPYAKLVIPNAVDGGQVSFYNGSSFLGRWNMDKSNIILREEPTSTSIPSGMDNVAIGNNALTALSSGRRNVAIGANTLQPLNSRCDNTVVGTGAGQNNSGENNTFIGNNAGQSIVETGSSRNTTIGNGTFQYSHGDDNACIGYNACSGSSGNLSTTINKNAAVGSEALKFLRVGDGNVALGGKALGNLDSGSYNVAVGYNACGEVTEGSYITCIGANSGPHADSTAARAGAHVWDTDHQRTYIGGQPKNFGGDAILEIHNVSSKNNNMINEPSTLNGNSTTVINGNLIVRGKIYFTFGDNLYSPGIRTLGSYSAVTANNVCATGAQGGTAYDFNTSVSGCTELPQYSDRRLKNNISTNRDGIDKLMQLNIYEYNFKNDIKKKPQIGVIAQELQKVFPNSVSEDIDGYLKIRWDEMFFAIVNAVKDINKKIVHAIKDIATLDSKITKLEKENERLKSKTNELTLRLQKLK